MFVSFLHPYQFKRLEAPYIWVFYKQINNLSSEEILFIGSEEYFHNPQYYKQKNRFELTSHSQFYTEYDIPSIEEISSYIKYFIDISIFDELERQKDSHEEVMQFLLTCRFGPLENEIDAIINKILMFHDIDAILTWVNCPSLNSVAEKYHLKVIHNELGPLRKPCYSYTAYFDFNGVNGNTEAAERYVNFLEELKFGSIDLLSRKDVLKLFVNNNELFNLVDSSYYDLGVPLQVEDDTNLIAFSNGYDNKKLLDMIGRKFKSHKVLVRKHPAGHHDYSFRFGDIDGSANSIEFIRKCKKVVTINSSVGFEAFFWGKKACILGDNPFTFISENEIKTCLKTSAESELFALNFILFAYLIPFEFVFDRDYMFWRLQNPSELEIYRFHFKYYNERANLAKNWMKYKINNVDLISAGLLKYCMRYKYDCLEANSIRDSVHNLKNTWSWKLTKPLRRFGSIFLDRS